MQDSGCLLLRLCLGGGLFYPPAKEELIHQGIVDVAEFNLNLINKNMQHRLIVGVQLGVFQHPDQMMNPAQ